MILTLDNIAKSYNGKKVISNINLEIYGHAIYCLLGKNGAGKSTLINIISNIIEPDSGQIFFNELSYPKEEIKIKKILGLQSQFDQVIGELNAYDYLEWIGMLYGMTKSEIASQTENLLHYFFEDEENLNLESKKYSDGMKKKLAICSAILHKPQVLILDEPFANLDPVASSRLCDFLIAYKSNDRIILVSSHDLLYVDRIATHIGIIHNNQLIFNNTLDKFKENRGNDIDKSLLTYLNSGPGNVSLLDSII